MTDSAGDDSVLIVHISIPHDAANDMARRIVENRLAACVSVDGEIESLFRWDGEVQHEPEARLTCKTTGKRLPELIEFVKANHSYDLPEIIAIPVTAGLPEYLDWVRKEVEQRQED